MANEKDVSSTLNDRGMPIGTTEKCKNNHRWNFSMGMVHAVFFSGATSFIHPDTVIPLFLSTLTSSSMIIGIASMIRGTLGGLGSVIPQLFVAAHLHNVTQRKPFLVRTLIVRAACFFLLSLITLLLYDQNPSLLIVSGLTLSFIFSITGGVASVPFYDIWSRSLPHEMLGTFFAHRHLWGGLFAIIMGLVVSNLLGCPHLENRVKYAILFLGAAFLMSIGFFGLAFVREHPARKYEQTTAKSAVLMLARNTILSDKRLRLYLCAFFLSGAPAMVLPFIVLFAREHLSFNAADVGIFLAIQMTGSLSVALLWGRITDKYGCKVTAGLSSLVSIMFLAAATMPLLFPYFPRTIMYGIYGLIGAWTTGRQVCFDKMLLRMSSEKLRPIYIALKGTFSFPLVLYPLAGAFLLRWTHSYGLLLSITIVLSIAGYGFSLLLPSSAQLNNAQRS